MISVIAGDLTPLLTRKTRDLGLDELARDRVSLSCTIVLPLRVLG
jgi:hypothetical protein